MAALDRTLAVLCLGAASFAAQAFEVNGIALGGSEADIRGILPSAYCRPLEWASRAADRRCDDARVSLGGTRTRVTSYLKAGVIVAIEVRFDASQQEAMLAYAKSRWGAPASERTESLARPGRADREFFKVKWIRGQQQAVMTVPQDRKGALLRAWRGNFDEEIYRVR